MPSHEPLPLSFGRLLAGQLRATGFALVREAMLAGAALALICVLSLAVAWRENDQLFFQPELLTPTLLIAALLPFAVWKGDAAFGHGFLWTLPVRRQHAAIAKVLAGAVWLLAAMLVTCAALSLVALLSGGGLGFERTRLLDSGTGEVAAAAKVVWTMPGWMWLMPFGGVLIFYFASSAAILGLRHPIRTLGGAVIAVLLFTVVALSLPPNNPLQLGIGEAREAIWAGGLGLDFALNGGDNALSFSRQGSSGRWVRMWRALPEFGGWAMATLLWLSLSLGALALAIRRHWER